MVDSKLQSLRKRRIVVLGVGTGVFAFCKNFNSKYAEVTLVTQQGDFVPISQIGLMIASETGDKLVVSLPEKLYKKRDFKWVDAAVESVDPKARSLKLSDGKILEYDYLVVGPSGDAIERPAGWVCDLSSAVRFKNEIETSGAKSILVRGDQPLAYEIAAAVAPEATELKPDRKVQLVRDPESDTHKQCFKDPKKAAIEARRARTGVVDAEGFDEQNGVEYPVLQGKTVTADIVVETRHVVSPVGLEALEVEFDECGRWKTRLDMTPRGQPRVFILGELTDVQDGLGKNVPYSEWAVVQKSRYVAKSIRGIIEGWTHYNIDRPAFIYKNRGTWARLGTWNAFGDYWKFYPRGPIGGVLYRLISLFSS